MQTIAEIGVGFMMILLVYALCTESWEPRYGYTKRRIRSAPKNPAVSPISQEEKIKQERQAFVSTMQAKYPIQTSASGNRYIRVDGKRNTVTYNIRDGQSDYEAYAAFQKMADLISQDESIYGEF